MNYKEATWVAPPMLLTSDKRPNWRAMVPGHPTGKHCLLSECFPFN